MSLMVPQKGQVTMSSKYDDLEKLADLMNKGIITEEEFNEQKAKILNLSSNSKCTTGTTNSKKSSSLCTCKKCGEETEEGFDICWNCGTPLDGASPENPEEYEKVKKEVQESNTEDEEDADDSKFCEHYTNPIESDTKEETSINKDEPESQPTGTGIFLLTKLSRNTIMSVIIGLTLVLCFLIFSYVFYELLQ